MAGGQPHKRRLFEEEVLPELDVLFAAALYLARNQEAANDLCEKTIVRAYSAFSIRARGASNRRAWLLTILHEIRRAEIEKAAVEVKPAALQTADASQLKACSPLVESAGVDEALQSLPDDFKAAVVMVDVAKLTYREAAKVLEVPIETVRLRISKGRALMRTALATLRGPGGLASA
jgi:RNA polymerase sigma-70 factor, ECF subfamily